MHLPPSAISALMRYYYDPILTLSSPNFNHGDQQLFDCGLLEVVGSARGSGAFSHVTRVSDAGFQALVENAPPSKLIQLVELCCAHDSYFGVVRLIPHIPVELLPELLAHDYRLIREAAALRLDELNE